MRALAALLLLASLLEAASAAPKLPDIGAEFAKIKDAPECSDLFFDGSIPVFRGGAQECKLPGSDLDGDGFCSADQACVAFNAETGAETFQAFICEDILPDCLPQLSPGSAPAKSASSELQIPESLQSSVNAQTGPDGEYPYTPKEKAAPLPEDSGAPESESDLPPAEEPVPVPSQPGEYPYTPKEKKASSKSEESQSSEEGSDSAPASSETKPAGEYPYTPKEKKVEDSQPSQPDDTTTQKPSSDPVEKPQGEYPYTPKESTPKDEPSDSETPTESESETPSKSETPPAPTERKPSPGTACCYMAVIGACDNSATMKFMRTVCSAECGTEGCYYGYPGGVEKCASEGVNPVCKGAILAKLSRKPIGAPSLTAYDLSRLAKVRQQRRRAAKALKARRRRLSRLRRRNRRRRLKRIQRRRRRRD